MSKPVELEALPDVLGLFATVATEASASRIGLRESPSYVCEDCGEFVQRKRHSRRTLVSRKCPTCRLNNERYHARTPRLGEAPASYVCEDCGSLVKFKIRQRPVSQKCRACRNRQIQAEAFKKRYKQKPRTKSPVKLSTGICRNCSAEFTKNRSDRLKFCSNECHNRYRRALKSTYGPRCSVHFFLCEVCAKQCISKLSTKKLCNECGEARLKERLKRPPVEKNCEDCGCSIIGNKAKKICKECRNKRLRLIRKANREPRRGHHAERARKYAVSYEAVNPIAVFKRDGWRCQLCKVKTPQKLRGTRDPRAPQLDHIIPLSKGGEHSYRNTQCACAKCNMKKWTKPLGQMRLFG